MELPSSPPSCWAFPLGVMALIPALTIEENMDKVLLDWIRFDCLVLLVGGMTMTSQSLKADAFFGFLRPAKCLNLCCRNLPPSQIIYRERNATLELLEIRRVTKPLSALYGTVANFAQHMHKKRARTLNENLDCKG